MDIKPLPKRIYDAAKQLKVRHIRLQFSGGSDEGNLYVDIDSEITDWQVLTPLDKMIEEWAWDVYSYSGAGDGSDYGDDIEYDLENGKVTASEWYTSRVDGDSETLDLALDEDNEA
jgi:hypothetical protein